jgi:hypothetical protein
MMQRAYVLWISAIILGMVIMFYQRVTGPTYPKLVKQEIEQQIIKCKLPRSWTSGEKAVVEIPAQKLHGKFLVSYRRFKSYDVWATDTMQYKDGKYFFLLPTLPPAGKIVYSLAYYDGNVKKNIAESVVLRYKGKVPTWILIFHVFMMILSVFWGIRAGLEAIFRRKNLKNLSYFATLFLFIGGLILGPIVQYYAFGAFWTGWPLGHDLTDNKTAVSIIFWFIALWKLRKNPQHWKAVLLASAVQVLMYFIPHSVLGSEIDFTKE